MLLSVTHPNSSARRGGGSSQGELEPVWFLVSVFLVQQQQTLRALRGEGGRAASLQAAVEHRMWLAPLRTIVNVAIGKIAAN